MPPSACPTLLLPPHVLLTVCMVDICLNVFDSGTCPSREMNASLSVVAAVVAEEEQ